MVAVKAFFGIQFLQLHKLCIPPVFYLTMYCAGNKISYRIYNESTNETIK